MISTKICSYSDNENIFVIYIADTKLLGGEENSLLDDVANKFKNESIKVFYINPNQYKYLWVSFDREDNGSKFIILKGKR
jgi:hypothetical protein